MKASLLRVAGTTDFAQDLLGAGQQVAISVAFLETSAVFVSKLAGRQWRVGEINGRQSGEANEAARVAFQSGQLDAIVFTVTEAVSLHRNEMPGGERNRSLIVHDAPQRHSTCADRTPLSSGWRRSDDLLRLCRGLSKR